MAGNALPQFIRQATASIGALITAALTTSDGSSGTIGTNIFTVFNADATNGSFVEAVRFIPVASAANTTTTATTCRLYLASVTSGTTSTTTCALIGECFLPSTTADSSTSNVVGQDIPVGFRIPAGYALLASIHSGPAANTSIRAVPIGAGDY
jgi:hypothetical protein